MPRSAVTQVAEMHGDIWDLEDDRGPFEDDDARADARLRRHGFTREGIDARKSKAALYEDAAEAGIEGRSKMTKAELVHALVRHSDRETARARP